MVIEFLKVSQRAPVLSSSQVLNMLVHLRILCPLFRCPPASHGATQTAAFYKALETGVPHNGRRVKIDYSQSALPDRACDRQNMNDGTRDIGNTQGPVLFFRGLDPLSGPQAIAQAMNSAGPRQSGAKGIILIKAHVG
jgi:RNA-binding protein 5/10